MGWIQDRVNPPEMHIPGYQYCGPFTKLQKRLARGDPGINRVDKACKKHDIAYSQNKDTKQRHVADQQLLDDLETIENPTRGFYPLGEREARAVIKPIIRSKKRFGLGISPYINMYCLKCKQVTDTENIEETTTKNGRPIAKGVCAVCGTKKSRFLKKNLKEVYYDPETGYCGVTELHRKTGLPYKDIREFLHQQDEYTKHKPIRKRFKRRRTYVSHIDDQWQADLVDIQKFKSYNDNTNYILTVIDIFSKYAWGIPIKRKTGDEITKAFTEIFKDRKPERLQTDKGTEFINKQTQQLFKDNNIHWFATENIEIKCSVVERFNRTLKTRMWKYFTANNTKKWIDVLDKLIKNYNNSYHRSIKMTPVEASKKKNESKVYNNLFKIKDVPKPKYAIGDKVRISVYKQPFKKGYLPNYTEEIFKISEALDTDPITYRIKDLNDEEIKGTFYESELVRYDKKDEVYKIEKIIRKKGDKYFVKWLGYPDSFNSWINKSDLVSNSRY